MHGHIEKKKHLEEKKEAPAQPLITMTEGPMHLKSHQEQHERERILKPGTRFDVQLLDESRPIQEMARKNYEKSLELEIAALKKELIIKKAKKGIEKKKPRYGWKMDTEPPPEPPDKGKDKKE